MKKFISKLAVMAVVAVVAGAGGGWVCAGLAAVAAFFYMSGE